MNLRGLQGDLLGVSGPGERHGQTRGRIDDQAQDVAAAVVAGGVELLSGSARCVGIDIRVEDAFLGTRLERIPGVVIPRDRLTKRPSFPLDLVLDEDSAKLLLDAVEWCLTTCAASATRVP
jgi:hypothetical protein